MLLDKQQKENWLTALRSGEYKQGKGQLHHPKENTYCCIGVFAVCNGISLNSGGYSMRIDGEEKGYEPLYSQIGAETAVLWRMNDTHKKSFLEIADWIEQNL